MKKIIITAVLSLSLLSISASALAGSCEYDSIVKGWLSQRNGYALKLVKAWLSGEPNETLAPLVGLVWASETNITTRCRKETDYLERNRLLFGNLSFPLTVDTAPPLVFQRLIKDDVLSPERQYEQKRKEVR